MVKVKRLTYETRQLARKAVDADVRRKSNILALEKQFSILDKDIRRMIGGVRDREPDLVVR